MSDDIVTVEVWIPITELHYIGWAKIKTNSHKQQTWTEEHRIDD